MPYPRAERLAGVLADRRHARPQAYRDDPHWARNACGHLVDWPLAHPRSGDAVWCTPCGTYSVVTFSYRRRRGEPMCCGATRLGAVPDMGVWHEGAMRAVTLLCSEPAGHDGDHYDQAFCRAWPREP